MTPQTVVRDVCIKNYIICTTGEPVPTNHVETSWDYQLTKDRNDDIWGNSSGDEESIW